MRIRVSQASFPVSQTPFLIPQKISKSGVPRCHFFLFSNRFPLARAATSFWHPLEMRQDRGDALLCEGASWRDFPTRIEVAARNADLLFGCYASALRGGRVALGEPWPDTIVTELEGRE